MELGKILDQAASECAEWWIGNLVSFRIPLTPAVGASVLTRCVVMGMGLAERCKLPANTVREYLLACAFAGTTSAEEALLAARTAYDKLEARKDVDEAKNVIQFPGVFTNRRKG